MYEDEPGESICESSMHPLWPTATLLRSRQPKGLLSGPNLCMPGLDHLCVLEESGADTKRGYGHEPSPNYGHQAMDMALTPG